MVNLSANPTPSAMILLAFLIMIGFWDKLGTKIPMKTKQCPKLENLLIIKNGNVSVKIYSGKNRVNGTHYKQFTLSY
jgi:hypothetical protein